MATIFQSLPNAVSVLVLLIKKLKIQVSPFTIQKDLIEHPDYPNMLALSDCLTSWKIPNEAYIIEKDVKKIAELEFPFIAHLNVKGGQYIVVDAIKNGQVLFSNEKEKKGTLSYKEFFEKWDGIILYAEKGDLSREANYNQSLIKGLINSISPLFLAFIISIIIIYRLSSIDTNQSYLFLIITKLSGLILSGFLIMYSIDSNNPFIKNLCSLGKKNDCNAILKSEAAKVTRWLNWSEVGMVYFFGSFLSLLIAPSSVELMSWCNILCLPYTFYSIGYQMKLKNWCTACCLVQAILWLEALLFYFGHASFKDPFSSLSVSVSGSFNIIICFLIPIAIWSFIKPYLLDASQVLPLKQQLKKFKYNGDLFNQFLSSQVKYAVPDDIVPIVLGNPDAETVITMVTNPFCDPCGATHKILDEWVNERNDIQVKIVFTTANDDNDKRTKVARHVIALSLLNDKQMIAQALNDWYNQSSKRYVIWAEKYPIMFNNEVNVVTEKQKDWCDIAEISYTPTILINGCKLVDPYRLEDVKYLLST